MEAQGIGLKRRIGLLVASVFVVASVLAAPAQAASLGQRCENRHPGNQDAQERCCKKQADTKKERKRCLEYVRTH
jgi:hypothetical protein